MFGNFLNLENFTCTIQYLWVTLYEFLAKDVVDQFQVSELDG